MDGFKNIRLWGGLLLIAGVIMVAFPFLIGEPSALTLFGATAVPAFVWGGLLLAGWVTRIHQ